VSAPGRTPAWLARVAVVALLLGAVFPLLALAFAPADSPASHGPALAALSSALEKAQRCLQGDGRTALDPVSPSVAPCAEAAAVAAPSAAAAGLPPAPAARPDAAVHPVDVSRRL
jgi:hypothetical protein